MPQENSYYLVDVLTPGAGPALGQGVKAATASTQWCLLGSAIKLNICSHSPPNLKGSDFARSCCDDENSSRAIAVSCL